MLKLGNGEEGNEEKDVYYITGTLFNSMAEIKFLDKDEKLIQEDIQITEQGFFSSIYNSTASKRFFICISFLDIESFPKESFSYSIQIQGKKTFKAFLILFKSRAKKLSIKMFLILNIQDIFIPEYLPQGL